MSAGSPLQVLLPTLGSAGDVHPFIALGVAMQARGHSATVLTNPIYQPLIEAQGLKFLGVGTAEDVQLAIGNPDLWHLRKGFKIIARLLVPAIAQVYGLIERHAAHNCVVAFSSLALGARVAQEKLGVPSASVHLQPTVIRTLGDQGMMGNVRMSGSQPQWLKRGLFRLIDEVVVNPSLEQPLNQFRAQLKLAPVRRPMHRWIHSPQLVIAFFPEWFAAPQPDWPPHTQAVGFPLWDDGDAPVSREAEAFLSVGPAPLIFTPGSAGSTMQRFFAESVAAARLLGMRAMLITNFPDQVPRELPPGIEVFGYVPFSQVLPHAALLVYHGGIGTLAQGIKAGVPHLVVPQGYDQFDSAWRIERLELGSSIGAGRYRAHHARRVIEGLLTAGALAQSAARRQEFAARIDARETLTRACELLEALQRDP